MTSLFTAIVVGLPLLTSAFSAHDRGGPNKAVRTTGTQAIDCSRPISSQCQDSEAKDFAALKEKLLAKIGQALEAGALAAGKKNFAEFSLEELGKLGVPIAKVAPSSYGELSKDVVHDWWMPGDEGPFTRTLEKLSPSLLKNCEPQKNSKVRALDLEANLKLYLSKLPLQELLSEIRRSCHESRQVPLPKICEDKNIRSLYEETVQAVADGNESNPTVRNKLISHFLFFAKPENFIPSEDFVNLPSEALAFESKAKLCESNRHIFSLLVTGKLAELRDKLVRAKPVIRSLEKNFLSSENQQETAKLVSQINQNASQLFLKEIAPRLSLPTERADALANEIANVPFLHEEVLSDALFAKEPDFPLAVWSGISEELSGGPDQSSFSDPALSSFVILNASFQPASFVGNKRSPEGIRIAPSFLMALAESPERMRSVLEHEIGHKVDPILTLLTGEPLREAYKDLLTCFRKTFRMLPNQGGESVADWVASRLGGERIAAIADPLERSRSAREYSKGLCLFYQLSLEDNQKKLRPDPTDRHPDQLLRMDRIYGSDPQLRQALGCPVTDHCTLNGLKKADKK